MSKQSIRSGSRWLLMQLAALSVTWSIASNASEIYKWVSEDGVVHYSDTRPENETSVTTLQLRELNSADYDPATDPYSILNQAKRTNESWTERVVAQQQARPRSEQAWEEGLYASPNYSPYTYYPAIAYSPVLPPPRGRRLNPTAARQQLDSLNAFDLVGRRSGSINSDAHRNRVVRSRALPVVNPSRGSGFVESP